MILDDSHRERYAEAFTYVRKKGFKVLSLQGLKVSGYGLDQATIIYREGNCLGI